MDLAQGRSAFTGRGQKPSNKDVLAAIAAIQKCQQELFFTPSTNKPCSCGWHTKTASRKQARKAQSDAFSPSTSSNIAISASYTPATGEPSSTSLVSISPPVSVVWVTPPPSSGTAVSTSSTTSSADQPIVGSGPVPPKFDMTSWHLPSVERRNAQFQHVS